PGEVFGMVALIDGGRRSASCVTVGKTRLFRLWRQDFDQLFSSGNRFAFGLVDGMARQLVRHLRSADQLLAAAETSVEPSPFVPGTLFSDAELATLDLGALPESLGAARSG
ncbi:MAG: cyclic nucleotide-binding domain-containing protein, partial [Myxococcaceae bacterium]